jgi:hypothetical protein
VPTVLAAAKRLAMVMGNIWNSAHMFMIAPPFVHDEAAAWDLERLDYRLNALQGWVMTANGGLFA